MSLLADYKKLTHRLLTVCVLFLTACSSRYTPDSAVSALIARGETSQARVDLATRADAALGSREQLLFNQQALHVALLDGLPEVASARVEYVYDTLRTQGLNQKNNPDPFFLNEQGVRIWKGEPFEQALALCLIAVADMTTGRWGNARAASIESLSRLQADGSNTGQEFVLGRLLAGIANRQLGRTGEAAEHFSAARSADPRVQALADELELAQYNALLVVEYGRAPAKTAGGTDGTEVIYRVRTPSTASGLRVNDANSTAVWPWVTDSNGMAADNRWTGLDQARRNKSNVGSLMTVGGVAVAASSDDTAAQAAGLGAALIGLIAKSNAAADTRYNDLLAQRIYLIPVIIAPTPPTLSLEGQSASTLRPLGLLPAESGLAVRLLRIPEAPAENWMDSGTINYANDVTGALPEPTLPWILGGRCVRTPTRTLMAEYYRAGLSPDFTYEDLLEKYRSERIDLLAGRDQFQARGHILEGGSTLYTPQGGTIGFTRLFGSRHPLYEPLGTAKSAIAPDTTITPIQEPSR